MSTNRSIYVACYVSDCCILVHLSCIRLHSSVASKLSPTTIVCIKSKFTLRMGNRPPVEGMYKCTTEADSRVSSTIAESVNTNQWKLIGSGAWNDYVHVTAPYKY